MAKKVADQLVEMLLQAGIKRVYGITGDSLNELNDAVRRSPDLQWVHVRNEEAGAFAAQGEALVTGNLTQGSATVSNVTPSVGIVTGMPLFNIQGLFPQGTTVASISGTSVTMSQPASITMSNAQFEISGLINLQWRAGTPSNPNWTSFIADQFELVEQGHSGIVRVYGVMPRIYNNMIRATYVAGFPYDWQNAGNNIGTHQVPGDLTDTCENVVVRVFKRRLLAGQASENIQGATISWRNDFDIQDKVVINHYKREVITV